MLIIKAPIGLACLCQARHHSERSVRVSNVFAGSETTTSSTVFVYYRWTNILEHVFDKRFSRAGVKD